MIALIKQKVLSYPGIFACVWTLIIFVLCATPGRYIPSASWLDALSFDKLVHAGIFFVLCGFLFLSAIKHHQHYLFIVMYLLLAVLYGGFLEYMQAHYFSERSADWQDIVANSTGCLAALFFIKKFRNFYPPLKK